MSRLVNRARHARPLFLLLIGMLFGAVIVGPVAASINGPSASGDAVTALTTYTRSASCAGLDFYPTDSATSYSNNGSLRIHTNAEGTGVFRCDPGLPSKAVVTKVQFTLQDGSVTGEAGPCALVRSGLLVTNASVAQEMASVPATTWPAYPGTVRLTDSSIAFGTIDNTRYGYWLECTASTWGGGPYFGIYGANVTYTISSVAG